MRATMPRDRSQCATPRGPTRAWIELLRETIASHCASGATPPHMAKDSSTQARERNHAAGPIRDPQVDMEGSIGL